MRVFFDASAFAKRYVREKGTDGVLAWCNRADEIALSVIAIPEIVSALCRLRRSAVLTGNQYEQCKANFLGDIADALICDTSPQVIQLAVSALEQHALRGMDAIHIGAALACEADVFVTAAVRQRDAAMAMGLSAD